MTIRIVVYFKGRQRGLPAAASNLRVVQFVKRCTINKGREEFLDHAPYINRPRNDMSALLALALKHVGRFLLMLAAIELISMPLTQYAWTWDHFLHGGIDFESSLLFLVICLHLLLVLRNHRRQEENLSVPMGRLSLAIFDTQKSATMRGTGLLSPFHRRRRAGSGWASYNLPLQI
ncbi:MAG: hypothetical protein WCF30_14550 [Terracidiphilus sp.]